jgi:hypothetical protein
MPAPKRTAAQRVAPNLAWGFVAPQSQSAAAMLPRRASPQAKLGATNVTVFMFMTTWKKSVAGSTRRRTVAIELNSEAWDRLIPIAFPYEKR